MPKKYSGRVLSTDNKSFVIFRRLKVKAKDSKSLAVFKVKFKFRNLPANLNKYLSLIPAPFLIAISGFREKFWMMSEDGYFQGIYQWETEDAAKKYPKSFIYKLMTKRAAKGTLKYEIIPNMNLSGYIQRHIKK